MFFKKKIEEVEEVSRKWVSYLSIELTNGKIIGWSLDIKEGSSKKGYWNNSLKWYFGRPQSKNYRMAYKNGTELFKRENIYGFKIIEYQIDK